jgi:hypothetical protein
MKPGSLRIARLNCSPWYLSPYGAEIRSRTPCSRETRDFDGSALGGMFLILDATTVFNVRIAYVLLDSVRHRFLAARHFGDRPSQQIAKKTSSC